MKINPTKWFFVVMLLMLSGCTPAVSPIIADTTCEAPCWRNIRPGVTTKEELIKIIDQMPDADSKSNIYLGPRQNKFDDIIIVPLPKNIRVSFYIMENKVVDISFSGKNLATFRQAVEKYGEPVYILNIPAMAEGFLFGDALHGFIIALLPDRGITYGYDVYFVSRFDRENITPKIKLRDLDYFDPEKYEELLDAGLFSKGTSVENAKNSMRPWVGYGSLEELYYP